MYAANRVVTLCAYFCAVSILFAVQLQAADDATSSQTGPEGQVPGVEKSILNPKAIAQQEQANIEPEFCKCISESNSDSVKRIERALRDPLHANGLDFTQTPLQEVVTQLQDDYGIPIQLDTVALEEIGVSPDEQVNINIHHNVSLRAALRLMLAKMQLTYVTVNDVLMITTPDEAEKDLRICVYDVTSISGTRDTQLDGLIDTIVACVATETWAKNGGGEAEIRPVKPGLLVISQTRAVHEEIRDLIGTLRKMQSEAKPNQTAGHDTKPSSTVVTRSYILAIQPNDSDNVRSQVRELILASLPNETWSGRLGDGQAVTLNVIHDRVVVRQTPSVQEEVERILTDSGIALPASAIAAKANLGGGFGGGGGGFGGGGGNGGGFFRPNTRDVRNPLPSWPRQVDPAPAADDTSPEGAAIKADIRPAPDDLGPFNE